MKDTNRLKVMKTEKALTKKEQIAFRSRLKRLLKLEGMISMCLESHNLYVEYNPKRFNIESFKSVLNDIGFPHKQELNVASFHYAV